MLNLPWGLRMEIFAPICRTQGCGAYLYVHLRLTQIRGPFEKFVDSHYYSESELCGGAVTVSFSKCLPLQAMYFLQRSTHFSKTCCRKSLGAPFSWLEEPRNRMGQDLNWILCSAWKKWIGGTPLEHPPYSPDLAPCDFWTFPTMKRELWGKKFRSDQRPAARFREVSGVIRSASVAEGGSSEKRISQHLHIVPTRSNKVSPRTFQYTSISMFIENVKVRWSCPCALTEHHAMMSPRAVLDINLYRGEFMSRSSGMSQLRRPRLESSPSWKSRISNSRI
jgi:hypothetical protein